MLKYFVSKEERHNMSLNSVTRKKRLTKRALKRALERQGLPKINIVFYDETDSTNTRARLYAECCEDKKRRDTLFVARKQRGGRGRMGRSFVSRGETGLCGGCLDMPLAHLLWRCSCFCAK